MGVGTCAPLRRAKRLRDMPITWKLKNRRPSGNAVESMRSVPGLRSMDTRLLNQIAPLFDEVEVKRGCVLIREGTWGHHAYVVVEGEAEVGVDGRSLGRVGAGDIVGETRLLDGGPRTATVTALTPMRVLCLDGRSLESILRMDGVAPAMLAQMAGRLRRADLSTPE